ncbi:MAG: hypothetical protein IT384_08740 [Deltaproteobacteria bacterium]|nr:hypothetical protein [Deltaproteobacteria bacterium]
MAKPLDGGSGACLVASVLTSSCLPVGVLPAPPVEGPASVVLIFDLGGVIRARALESLAPGEPIRFAAPREATRVGALAYRTPLATIDLAAGEVEVFPIELDAQGEERTDRRSWPPSAEIWSADAGDADAGWRKEESFPDWIAALRIRRKDACTRFRVKTFAVAAPAFSETSVVQQIDAESVLIGAWPKVPEASGVLFRLDRAGARGELRLLPPTEVPIAAIPTSSGAFVVVTSRGRLADIDADVGPPRFRAVPTATTAWLHSSTGGSGPSGLEILAWTAWGPEDPPELLHSSAGREWSVVFRPDIAGFPPGCTPGALPVLWLGAGRALLAAEGPFVYRWPFADSPPLAEAVAPGERSCSAALFEVESYGELMAIETVGGGTLLAGRKGEAWEVLLRAAERITAAVGFRGGRLLLGYESGVVQELILTPSGAVACAPLPGTAQAILHLVPLGDRWLIAGTSGGGASGMAFGWLEIEP